MKPLRYVIHAPSGVQLAVEAYSAAEARRMAYLTYPAWHGDWLVVLDAPPTQEAIAAIVAGHPEEDGSER